MLGSSLKLTSGKLGGSLNIWKYLNCLVNGETGALTNAKNVAIDSYNDVAYTTPTSGVGIGGVSFDKIYGLSLDSGNTTYYTIPHNITKNALNGLYWTVEYFIYPWFNYRNFSPCSILQLCGSGTTAGSFAAMRMSFNSANDLMMQCSYAGTSWNINKTYLNCLKTNAWQHVAIVRNNTEIYVFVNGIKLDTITVGANLLMQGFYSAIGTDYNLVSMSGQLRTYHVSDIARYTTDFTPITVPINADNNSLFLTLQTPYLIDESRYANSITRTSFEWDACMLTTCSMIPNIGNNLYNSSYVDSAARFRIATRGAVHFAGTNPISVASDTRHNLATTTTPFTVEAIVYAMPAGTYTATKGQVISEPNYGDGKTKLVFGYGDVDANGNFVASTKFAFGFGNSFSGFTICSQEFPYSSTWVHVVGTFDGQHARLYFNGQLVRSISCTAWLARTTASGFEIGKYSELAGGNYWWIGAISALRITHDVVYTPTVPVPTTAPTYVNGTNVLLNFDSLAMDAGPSRSISVVGNVTLDSTQKKFGANSARFQGGYLLVGSHVDNTTGKSDFSFDGWFYRVSNSNESILFDTRDQTSTVSQNRFTIGLTTTGAVYLYANGVTAFSTSAGAFSENQWNHILVQRRNGVITIYVNGAQTGVANTLSTAFTTTAIPLVIGNSSITTQTATYGFNGYIANVRFLATTTLAAFDSFSLPSNAPLENLANTKLNMQTTSIPIGDVTGKSSLMAFGDVSIATLTGQSGNKCIKFNGGYLVDPRGKFDYGIVSNNLTMSAWIYFTSSPTYSQCICSFPSAVSGLSPTLFLTTGGNAQLVYQSNGYLTSTALAINTWHHVAISKYGNYIKLFVNGALIGQISDYSYTRDSIGKLSIGALASTTSSPTNVFYGYMDNIVISRTTGIYRDAFTPEKTKDGFTFDSYIRPDPVDFSSLMTATNPVVASTKASGFTSAWGTQWYWKDANSATVGSSYQQTFKVQIDIKDDYPVLVCFDGSVDETATLTLNGDAASTTAYTMSINQLKKIYFSLTPGKNVLELKITNAYNSGAVSPAGFYARIFRLDTGAVLVNAADWKW